MVALADLGEIAKSDQPSMALIAQRQRHAEEKVKADKRLARARTKAKVGALVGTAAIGGTIGAVKHFHRNPDERPPIPI